jgi:uncharacterized integral membrane protein
MTATQNRGSPPGRGNPADPDRTTASPGREPDRWAKVPRSRMGGAWVVLLVAAFVLLLLLIFILQNGQRADVSYLGVHGHLPMGVALLLAAVFGVLLVALPGTARIMQLRMLSRRRGGNGAAPRPSPAPPTASEPTASEPTASVAAPEDPAGT